MPPKMPHVYGIYPHGMYDKKKKKKGNRDTPLSISYLCESTT